METYPMSFSDALPYRKLCRRTSVSDPAMWYWIGIAWRWNQIVYDRNYWPPDKCNMGSPDKCNMGITWVWTVFHLYMHIDMIIWLYCQNSGSQSDGLGPTPKHWLLNLYDSLCFNYMQTFRCVKLGLMWLEIQATEKSRRRLEAWKHLQGLRLKTLELNLWKGAICQ